MAAGGGQLEVQAATVQAATRGDSQALQALLASLQGPIYNLSLRMLASREDAEEASQEALLRVVTHLGSFRGEARFSTWAWSVSTRVVLEYRRRRARRPIPIEAYEADLADGLDAAAVERPEDRVLIQQVKLGCSRAMLQCLDDEHRLAYVLGTILEVPGPEAAAALGLSAAAYRKRLSRARTSVAANLQRVCGVVNPAAACRCHKRVRPARRLGRLDAADAADGLDLPTLRRQLAGIEALQRDRAFYGADPMAAPAPALLDRVRQALGMSA